MGGSVTGDPASRLLSSSVDVAMSLFGLTDVAGDGGGVDIGWGVEEALGALVGALGEDVLPIISPCVPSSSELAVLLAGPSDSCSDESSFAIWGCIVSGGGCGDPAASGEQLGSVMPPGISSGTVAS